MSSGERTQPTALPPPMARTDEAKFHHGLYEVHLPVTDAGRSTAFYVEKLAFEVGYGDPEGPSVLLLYGQESTRWMLGLFEVDTVTHRHPAESHVAFRIPESRADEMIPFLRERWLDPVHPSTAPQDGPMHEPIVHGWMPAAAVFFRDPDGHLLELLCELPGQPRPDVVYQPLREWRTAST